MFNKPTFRTKELSNGLYLAEKKDFFGYYSTLSYSTESKIKDVWIPTTFSSKENAEQMIEYFKRYENYIKENNMKPKPFTQIFLDEKDFLKIIGDKLFEKTIEKEDEYSLEMALDKLENNFER